jgi:hypothetical protein
MWHKIDVKIQIQGKPHSLSVITNTASHLHGPYVQSTVLPKYGQPFSLRGTVWKHLPEVTHQFISSARCYWRNSLKQFQNLSLIVYFTVSALKKIFILTNFSFCAIYFGLRTVVK